MKIKKALYILAISAAISTPALMQPIVSEAREKTFKDVPESHHAYKEITELANRNIIKGFGDGTFNPDKPLNRGEFASFVARSIQLPSAESNFKDVSKTSVMYYGISSAYKAGIIKGFSDGKFKPEQPVSRQDMAVMIDRAMQVKGGRTQRSYTKRKELDFSDSVAIGAYAKVSIERLYHYNVMAARNGTLYSPTKIGTRADTAKYLYKMLLILNDDSTSEAPTTPLSIEAIKKKNPVDLNHTEIVKAYGPYVISRRMDIFGLTKGIEHWDLWLSYLNYIGYAQEYKYKIIQKPDEWLQEMKEGGTLTSLYGEVDTSYPNYELIAVNGVPFAESELMKGNNLAIYTDIQSHEKSALIPKAPSMSGQFKIDIHYKKHDFAVYQKGIIKFGKQTVLPYAKDNKALMVDMKSAFTHAQGVTISANSISYGGNTVTFTNGSTTVQVNGENKTLSVSPEIKDGVQMLPIREVANYLGLITRVAMGSYVQKIEIQNYREADLHFMFR